MPNFNLRTEPMPESDSLSPDSLDCHHTFLLLRCHSRTAPKERASITTIAGSLCFPFEILEKPRLLMTVAKSNCCHCSASSFQLKILNDTSLLSTHLTIISKEPFSDSNFVEVSLSSDIVNGMDTLLHRPPPDWPSLAEVVFSDVSFRSHRGLPFVLNLDFRIQGGEKVGTDQTQPKTEPILIDIETGFPVDPDSNDEPNKGKVLIDGIDTSEVERGRPVRYNIELATKCSEKIWEELDMVELREVIATLQTGLDTPVA
ncbi:Multidrug resistance-associated protein [Blattamonas nauphoetae]|uniref:Multidrug resistance-associated protein n=1 Tax=Blattamonas nauphoetae TaxID=2049346 RepID=A0ABQ9WYA8_9EUKA|nr:Multidrug resistance-associated protein [Blattamonas nauphoetae]